ncbi:MAG: TonB family protein [Acidobacteria bacterium]|nr:TonB family protein [Acidobacteriota bacterium]
MRTGGVRAGLLVLVVAALGAPAAAVQDPTSLVGVVFDPTNRLIPGVSITLTPADTPSDARTAQTNGQGRYEFTGLRAGTYRFEARQVGFRTVTVDLTVTGKAEQSVRMQVGVLREELEIVASVDPRRSGRGRDIAPAAGRGGSAPPVADPCASGRPGRVGGLIAPPRKVAHVSPLYPDALRQARLGGSVELRATIGADGQVTGIVSAVPPGSLLLDATAAAVSQWRFQPAMLNCEPFAVEMHVVARFNPGQ